MSSQNIEDQLKSVGLSMQPYWNSTYFKNIDKLSKPIYQMKEERDNYVPVSDGTKLCLDIFRPDAPGKFPALLAVSCYSKDLQSLHLSSKIPPQDFRSIMFDHKMEAGSIDFFVKRGYVRVILDSRGVGKSEGEFYGFYSKQEQEDSYDIIEWIAQQPWCDGNVGMTGISYFGVIQRLVAALQPPHLKAIFPADAFDDFYQKAYNGGIPSPYYLNLERGACIVNGKSQSEILYTKEELEKKFREGLEDPDIKNNSWIFTVLKNPKKNPICVDMLLHPTDGPYWWERSPYKQLDKIKVPTYEGSFWSNHYMTEGNINCFSDPALNVPKKMTMFTSHPFIKLPGPPEWDPEILRWFDHWLKGVDTGIMDEPPIKLLVMGINKFRYEKEWPIARTKWTKFYFRTFGDLADEPEKEEELPPDTLVHTPPSVSNKVQSLIYSTPPLNEPVEITGSAILYLYASLDQEDANFIVHLYDVAPNGEKSLLEDGYLKASHRTIDESRSKPWRPYHNHRKPEPVKPGQIYQYVIPIRPISNVFLPRHRIEIEITTMNPIVKARYTEHPTSRGGAGGGLNTMGHLPSFRLTYYKIYRDAKYQSHIFLPIIPETPKELYIS